MAVDIWQRWTSSWQELTRHQQQYDDKLASAESDCEMSCAFCWAVGYSPQRSGGPVWGQADDASALVALLELNWRRWPILSQRRRKEEALLTRPVAGSPFGCWVNGTPVKAALCFFCVEIRSPMYFDDLNFFIKKLWYNHSKEHVGLWVNSDYLTRHSWVYTHLFSSVQ